MSLQVKVIVLSGVGSQFDCNFIKPGSRFSYRPEEWGQRVCYQKSCHEQSLERAASLGVQTLAGTDHLYPPSFSLFLSIFLCL